MREQHVCREIDSSGNECNTRGRRTHSTKQNPHGSVVARFRPKITRHTGPHRLNNSRICKYKARFVPLRLGAGVRGMKTVSWACSGRTSASVVSVLTFPTYTVVETAAALYIFASVLYLRVRHANTIVSNQRAPGGEISRHRDLVRTDHERSGKGEIDWKNTWRRWPWWSETRKNRLRNQARKFNLKTD